MQVENLFRHLKIALKMYVFKLKIMKLKGIGSRFFDGSNLQH